MGSEEENMEVEVRVSQPGPSHSLSLIIKGGRGEDGAGESAGYFAPLSPATTATSDDYKLK